MKSLQTNTFNVIICKVQYYVWCAGNLPQLHNTKRGYDLSIDKLTYLFYVSLQVSLVLFCSPVRTFAMHTTEKYILHKCEANTNRARQDANKFIDKMENYIFKFGGWCRVDGVCRKMHRSLCMYVFVEDYNSSLI